MTDKEYRRKQVRSVDRIILHPIRRFAIYSLKDAARVAGCPARDARTIVLAMRIPVTRVGNCIVLDERSLGLLKKSIAELDHRAEALGLAPMAGAHAASA